jgi:23S rRNA (pseudouridine1915-N3)-methyltransferase
MKIKLITVGKTVPQWVEMAYSVYAQRLPLQCSFDLIEIPLVKRSKNHLHEKWIKKEGDLILKAIAPSDWVIALDLNGQHWSTKALSHQMNAWQEKGRNITLLIGGPDGLSNDCLRRSQQKWSLSALTFPHFMVRVIVAEAIYRAYSITINHPYHRE